MTNGERIPAEIVLKPGELGDFRVEFLGRVRRLARLCETYQDPNVKGALQKSLGSAINEAVFVGLKP